MAAAALGHARPSSHGRPPSSTAVTLPLFDLWLDLPHPAAVNSSRPPEIWRAPSTSADMEQELNANLSRIGRFAFPEFDDAACQGVPRDTESNRFSQYAMQPKTFQHYTFSLQLQSGVRIHGHVRRYHPIHDLVKTRYDVGRRGERALVLLTRANGGDLVYSAILKTLDAIIFQKSALAPLLQPHDQQSEHWLLNKIFDQHRHMCATFNSLPQEERKPMVLTVDSLETGIKQIPLMEQADNSKFLIPTSLLAPTSNVVESVTSSSILPLLRTLGIQNTLRLLSALLSESRILLVSCSPTRLAQCARSALSVLAQGLLNWQHLYIPVLPPHLFQYLAAPVPYLIGMLTTMMPRLEQARADGLGEMVIIHLDTFQMETRGISPTDVARKIPDLIKSAMAEQGVPAAAMSSPEMLTQDLVDLLKIDKRTLYGESALTNVSETAAKATKAVKAGFNKLKERGKKFLQRSGSINTSGGSDEETEAGTVAEDPTGDPTTENTMLPDFVYTQGAQNEVAEEEARIAFSSFFLSMFGNMRWYLSANPGQLPQLDHQRFLQQKRAMGEGEHTPMWPLLENFCQTQMFQEFAKARVEEVRLRMPVTSDSPLFTQCSNYHRLHNVDFSVINVRRVARQVAQSNPSRIILQTQARRTAMLLTSNKTYDGDYNQAVAQLVEQCRECSSVLFDVMSVIWVRLRDSKGLHWKHGFQALQILRNMLYHGPLSAIAEATDGLDKIRVMKFYNDNMRSQICSQIRQVARQVYNLLVDRAKLYAIRRLCINKRRLSRIKDQQQYVRDTRMRVVTPFSAMHKAYNPRSANLSSISGGGPAPKAQFAAEQDLLGFGAGPPASTVVPPPASVAAASSSSASQDLADLFASNVSVSSSQPPQAPSNPFESISAPLPNRAAVDPFAAPVLQTPPPQPGAIVPNYLPQGQPALPHQQMPSQQYPMSQPMAAQPPYGAGMTSPQPPHHQPPQQVLLQQQQQQQGQPFQQQQQYSMQSQPGYPSAHQQPPFAQPYQMQGQLAYPPPQQQGYPAQNFQQPFYPQQQQQGGVLPPQPYQQQQQQGYQPQAQPPVQQQRSSIASQFDPFK